MEGRYVVAALVIVLLAGGIAYYGGVFDQAPTDTEDEPAGTESPADEGRTVVVSQDPLFTSFNGDGVITYSSPTAPSRNSISRGPWTINGAWKFLEGENRTFSLHPWIEGSRIGEVINNTVVSRYAEPSHVHQEVMLPSRAETRSLEAVLVARNGADTGEDCSDSTAALEVETAGGEVLRNATIVGDGTTRLTLNLTAYAGEDVTLRALGESGDDGCGMWFGEYTEIQALFINAERLE